MSHLVRFAAWLLRCAEYARGQARKVRNARQWETPERPGSDEQWAQWRDQLRQDIEGER